MINLQSVCLKNKKQLFFHTERVGNPALGHGLPSTSTDAECELRTVTPDVKTMNADELVF